jgi:hypothetical protein
MARGGARTGSGRKPKAGKVPPTVPFVSLPGGRAPETSAVSSIPPEDLPLEAREFWHINAGLAIAQGTLTVNTVPSFRMLCQLDAVRQKRAKKIEDDGETFIKCTVDGAGNEHQELKAHPLTGPHDRIAKQVEALMARFKLAPFGKAESAAPGRKTPAANPWSKVVNS